MKYFTFCTPHISETMDWMENYMSFVRIVIQARYNQKNSGLAKS